MAKEWIDEETREFMKKASVEVDDLCAQLNEETDFEKKRDIIDQMLVTTVLMSKVDTAHKNYLLKQLDNMCSIIKEKLGLA